MVPVIVRKEDEATLGLVDLQIDLQIATTRACSVPQFLSHLYHLLVMTSFKSAQLNALKSYLNNKWVMSQLPGPANTFACSKYLLNVF